MPLSTFTDSPEAHWCPNLDLEKDLPGHHLLSHREHVQTLLGVHAGALHTSESQYQLPWWWTSYSLHKPVWSLCFLNDFDGWMISTCGLHFLCKIKYYLVLAGFWSIGKTNLKIKRTLVYIFQPCIILRCIEVTRIISVKPVSAHSIFTFHFWPAQHETTFWTDQKTGFTNLS